MKQKTPLGWKLLKYTFWLGPFLMIMGLSAGFVSGTWEPIPLGLIIAGTVIMGLWFLFRVYFRQGDSLKHPYWSRRSTQAGTNALVATVSVFVIVGLINFLAVRHAVRLDLTENQQFTLAPQTETVLTNLEQPVKVLVFERTSNPQTKELLDRYRRIAPQQFSYEFIDPQVQPGVAQEYGVSEFGEVYLQSGNQRQSLPKEGLEVLTEAQLTNGIEQLLTNRTPKVYFLQGHGERPLTEGQGGLENAVNALNDKNFVSEPLTLTQQSTIPDDADVIVVAGPQRPLFEGEVEALDAYLEEGGSLLLMIDPKTDPGLNELLEKWGIKIDDRLAIDATGSGRLVGLGPTVPIVREYGEHPITEQFNNGISFYPLARPVETRNVEGITESPLIWTEAESWAETNLASRELEFNPDSDRKGPLSLGVALTKSVEVAASQTVSEPAAEEETTEAVTSDNPEEATTSENPAVTEDSPEATAETTEAATSDNPEEATTSENLPPTEDSPEATAETSEATTEEARLVVLGNSQFATNGWFEQQLNGDVFINTVSWLSKPDQATLSIRPKPATNRRIAMTPVLGRSISWVALVILPLFGFVTAAILWWRRR
ncbi:GldG family protein [Capilliphycus salinus ALCB114379]|uniref:GldG family protein n=1 Tax=Capilliphycus salinus TaxID=2768948 RepID=UPI0039A692BE